MGKSPRLISEAPIGPGCYHSIFRYPGQYVQGGVILIRSQPSASKRDFKFVLELVLIAYESIFEVTLDRTRARTNTDPNNTKKKCGCGKKSFAAVYNSMRKA